MGRDLARAVDDDYDGDDDIDNGDDDGDRSNNDDDQHRKRLSSPAEQKGQGH